MNAVSLSKSMLPGRSKRFGAFALDGGVNFAVFSENAERIEVCLFDAAGTQEIARHVLHGPHDGVFHGFLADCGVGLVYGLRAYGPYDPARGHRFNPNKLLLDPYAREIVGRFVWRGEHHGYELGHVDGTASIDHRDNATSALKARVPVTINTELSHTATLHSRRVAEANVVLYEVHVKGFSQQRNDIAPHLRGRFGALADPVSIAHFKRLGVTTLCLLPIQYHVDEPGLYERGLTNYWGYNTLGFFAPDPRFSQRADDPTAVNQEFRSMVEALHAHDIEVVLDVVYNHTPEGSEAGPTLSFRGLDNANWYRASPGDAGRCENLTGCGNTINTAHARVTQCVLDSLRYWVEVMGVDGFRFDLAPVLGRTRHGFDPNAAFFMALRQDPVLNNVRLIAEPWDAGYDGYQLGRFPGCFAEWNDKFRDVVREFWLYRGAGRGEFARRFSASSDLFNRGQRLPAASVNFITAHDGFTLRDVVSYSRKHNVANGEGNRDGRDGEACANLGVEGDTHDPTIGETRQRVARAMLATLLLAQGTPMLCAGDEIGNTQYGNNNAYCQDNPTTWLDWSNADVDLMQFVSRVLALRKAHPALRYDRWFSPNTGPNEPSLQWLNTCGQRMTLDDWHDASQHAFACELSSPTGAAVDAYLLLIGFNPNAHAVDFAMPDEGWCCLLNTADLSPNDGQLTQSHPYQFPAQSLVVWRRDIPIQHS